MFTPDSQIPVATRNLDLDGGDRPAIRDAITGRIQRNVAMIRQFAGGGEPVFQRMLPWAADFERSGGEVAGLPDEFRPAPGR
jgi:hypothetical protein